MAQKAKVIHRMLLLAVWLVPRCGPDQVKPVDVFPEDICALCRMAVSDERFACEVVKVDGEALKFDDLGCMEQYLRAKPADVTVAAVFYKDYGSGAWVPAGAATVVQTGIRTPMGSGKVAFADPGAAEQFRSEHPPEGGR